MYREWRLHWTWFCLYWLAASAPFVFLSFLVLLTPSVADRHVQPLRQFLDAYTSTNLYNSRWGMIASWMSVVLGVEVLRQDLARGGLVDALSGPVQREDVLRIKVLFGIVTIFAVYFTLPVVFACAYAAVGGPWRLGEVLLASLPYTVAGIALFMTGLAAAAVCSNWFLAICGAMLAASIPRLAGDLLRFFYSPMFTGQPLGTPLPHWVTLTSLLLKQLSPGALYPPPGGWVFAAYLVSYAAWAVGFWWLAQRCFASVPVERVHHVFFFPALWHVVFASIAYIVANLAANILVSTAVMPGAQGSPRGGLFLAWFAVFFIAVWGALALLARWRQRRRWRDEA